LTEWPFSKTIQGRLYGGALGVIPALIYCVILPFSVAWLGNVFGLRWLYARPMSRLGLCLALAGLACGLFYVNGLAGETVFASPAAAGLAGLSLIGLEVCAAFSVGIVVGWRSCRPWVRRTLLGLGSVIVVAAFILSAAAQSGEL
jgi:hypothetical protein